MLKESALVLKLVNNQRAFPAQATPIRFICIIEKAIGFTTARYAK